MAQSLNNLAGLYHTQGNYAQAEPLLKRSLAIKEKALGPEHPSVAASSQVERASNCDIVRCQRRSDYSQSGCRRGSPLALSS